MSCLLGVILENPLWPKRMLKTIDAVTPPKRRVPVMGGANPVFAMWHSA